MSVVQPSAAVSPARPAPRSWLVRTVACLGWLRGYNLAFLRGDVIAGITLAAYILPACIGYASLANLPPEAGLYSCLFGGLLFWVFCSSSRTAITVTSAISLLIGASLGDMAAGDADRFRALAACTAILVAAIFVVAWAVRAGGVVRFISETVLAGFKTGVAFYLASSQLPKFMGIKGAEGSFWHRMWQIITHLGDVHMTSLLVGLAALAVLIAGKLFLKNKPVAIVVVVGGILAGAWLDLGARGVKLLGDVPQGLPAVGLPAVTSDDLNELLPLALACFLLGAVETAAVGRTFAAKYGERFDANQELLALAGANLAAGLGQGYPVSGGMTQSLVNESAGARTPASGLVASGLMLLVAVFFSKLLKTLPQPVLAAIVLMAVSGLVQFSVFKRLWRVDRRELVIAAAALLGVLCSGLLRGVLIGVVLSLVLLIRAASRPNVAFLGRIPGQRRFSDMERHPDNERIPGLLIVRPEGGLFYFNTEHIHACVAERVRSESPRMVLCDLSAVPRVDLAGAEWVKEMAQRLAHLNVRLRIVEARAAVRDKLRAEGVEDVVGRIDRFTTVAEAVDAFLGGDAELKPQPADAPVHT
jgi:high affinity sulfate transporter 1